MRLRARPDKNRFLKRAGFCFAPKWFGCILCGETGFMELSEAVALRERIERFLCMIDDLVGEEDNPNKMMTPEILQTAEDLLLEGRKYLILADDYFEAGMDKASWGKIVFEEDSQLSEETNDDDDHGLATRDREADDRAFIAEERYHVAELTRPIEEAALELTNIVCDLRNLEEAIKEDDSAA